MSPATTVAAPFFTSTSGEVLLPIITFLLVTLVGAVIRYLPRVLTEFRAAIAEMRTTQLQMRNDLDNVVRELRTNHGSSLKDAVLRNTSKIDGLRAEVSGHLEHSREAEARLDNRLDRLYGRDDNGGTR